MLNVDESLHLLGVPHEDLSFRPSAIFPPDCSHAILQLVLAPVSVSSVNLTYSYNLNFKGYADLWILCCPIKT